MIIKPTESASGYGFKICQSMDDIGSTIESVTGTIDVMGNTVDEFVAEEYLTGNEYVICTVSHGGVHKVAAIYTYEESICDGVKFIRTLTLVDPSDIKAQKSIDYAYKVLDAMDYQMGQAAIEVMVSEHNTVKLIEFNPRVGGLSGLLDDMVELCTGNSHIKLTVESVYKSLDEFKRTPEIYCLKGCGVILWLKNLQDCTVESLKNFNKIKTLPSVRVVKSAVKVGDRFEKTIDVINSPGLVLLVNDSEAALHKDIETIAQLELEGLFVKSRSNG